MKKLIAIWKLIWAEDYAVFTYKEATDDPEWLTAPWFSWIVSKKHEHMFQLIRERLINIEKYNKDDK